VRRFGSTTLATIRRSSRLTALLTLLLVAAHPAHAQIETVLYSFDFDGSYPKWRSADIESNSRRCGQFLWDEPAAADRRRKDHSAVLCSK
jgi:hypothetical protein